MLLFMISRTTEPSLPHNPEANLKALLGWLALAHDRSGANDAEEVLQQLLLLRDTPLASNRRLNLLDLLHSQAERIVLAQLPHLIEVTLPISRKLRQQVRTLLSLLANIAQDYLNTLAELFDPASTQVPRPPQFALQRAMQAIVWQIRISHLAAAQPPPGIWQQLHASFASAQRLGLENLPGDAGTPSIRRMYTDALLGAVIQPAAFTPSELEFIRAYIEQCTPEVELSRTPPDTSHALFWISPERDAPAYALTRRSPNPDAKVLYFSGLTVSTLASKHYQALGRGLSPEIPDLAASTTGATRASILLRLSQAWGQPAKRRFPRRHQSYRVNLCSGLSDLWALLQSHSSNSKLSEWMVTNESPEGYSLMHIAGPTEQLRVGDIVALQPTEASPQTHTGWMMCLVRWAISENPEHIELGLQLLAARAAAVELAHQDGLTTSNIKALHLPPTPPLHPTPRLIAPIGCLCAHKTYLATIAATAPHVSLVISTGQPVEETNALQILSVSSENPP